MNKNDSMHIIRRLYMSLVPVQAMSVGMPAINTLLSSILIGRYLGQTALAAVGLVGPMLLCLNAFSKALTGGTQITAGKALGRGDRDGLVKVFNTVLITGVFIGTAVTILCLTIPNGLARLQGAAGESMGPTAEYIRGLGIGMGFSALSACIFIFLQLERMDKLSSILSVIMVGVNLGGNILNIFVLHLENFGAGMFLAVSNLIPVAIGLPALLTHGKLFRIDVKYIVWKEIPTILKLGSPGAVVPLCGMVRDRVLNYYILMLCGNVGIAALAVANNVATAICQVLQAGYSGSCEVVSGMLVGQRDVKSLRRLPETMVKGMGFLFILSYILIFCAARPFALLMGATAEELSIYLITIRMRNLYCIPDIFVTPVRVIYQTTGKIGLVNAANIVCVTVCPCLMCVMFAERMGMWLMASLALQGNIFLLILFFFIFLIRAHRMPHSPVELCYIPDSLSVPRESRYDTTILTIADAVKASECAAEFCRSKGLDEKTACYCGLCIEEIAADTVKNRFSGDKCTLDMRMVYENGHVRILFRDDCRHFDPIEWLSLCSPEDEMRSIGIRMVSRLAYKMEYASTLGLNVLTIEL